MRACLRDLHDIYEAYLKRFHQMEIDMLRVIEVQKEHLLVFLFCSLYTPSLGVHHRSVFKLPFNLTSQEYPTEKCIW